MTLTGVPASYQAGRSYDITVTLAREGMTRGGFEIAARFASGAEKGNQAGAWRAATPRLQIISSATDPIVLFVQHTTEGSVAVSPGQDVVDDELDCADARIGPGGIRCRGERRECRRVAPR